MDENVCQVCGRKPVEGEVLLSTIVCDPGGARRICGTHLSCVTGERRTRRGRSGVSRLSRSR